MIKNEKGWTLTELMISVSVLAVVAAVMFMALRVSWDAFDTSNVRMSLQTSAREGLYRMTQELRTSASNRVSITNGGSTIQFTVPNPSSPVTSSYATNWGDQIQYALGTGNNSTKIVRTDLTTNQTKIIAHDVTSVTFTGNTTPPTVVTVTMNVQKSLSNGRTMPETPIQISGQAKVRNS